MDISPEIPGFEYWYRECTKQGIFGCRKWEMKVEYFNLTDPAVRKKLIDMGFIARVREKVMP